MKAKTKQIRKRVGFVINDAGIVRENVPLTNLEGKQIGITTSGSFSPSLKKSIGIAYVDEPLAKDGIELFAEQRGKKLSATITKMPFVPSKYFKSWPKK